MTAIYRIRSASYYFLGQYPLKVGAAFSKLLFQNTARLTYFCEKKNRDEGSQHSSVFSGLKTFKVEPFDHFSLKMLPGETLCNFSQIFPPKKLEKVRALKVRMRQLFFSKKPYK